MKKELLEKKTTELQEELDIAKLKSKLCSDVIDAKQRFLSFKPSSSDSLLNELYAYRDSYDKSQMFVLDFVSNFDIGSVNYGRLKEIRKLLCNDLYSKSIEELKSILDNQSKIISDITLKIKKLVGKGIILSKVLEPMTVFEVRRGLVYYRYEYLNTLHYTDSNGVKHTTDCHMVLNMGNGKVEYHTEDWFVNLNYIKVCNTDCINCNFADRIKEYKNVNHKEVILGSMQSNRIFDLERELEKEGIVILRKK